MVIWGAIWGAVLGWLWPGNGFIEFLAPLAGGVLGAIAGRTLRGLVRGEIDAQREQWEAKARVVSAADFALPGQVRQARPAQPTRRDGQGVPSQGGPDVQAPPQGAAVAPITTSAPGPVPTLAQMPPSSAAPMPASRDAFGAPWPSNKPGAAETPWPDAPAPPSRPDPVTLALGKFKSWLLGGNSVVRMGVLVLFVGLAFLAKYAAEHALLPPELRLAAIACAGIALFAFGFRLRRKQGHLAYALSLQGAGVAVLYLTVFAAL